MPQPQKAGAKGIRKSGNRTGRPSALSAALFLALAVPAFSAPPRPAACVRVELTGKANAGQEWKESLGEGWVLRVVPIAPRAAGYTGWDLVVDRDPPAGFPDALLLATPPYNSINEREVGTTYGLRAQDAVGWNPRGFRFLVNPADFVQGQELFLALCSQLQTPSGKPPRASANQDSAPANPAVARLTRQLMDLQSHAASGELRILDAGLAPGIADPEPFAQSWALRAARMQTTLVPRTGSQPTPRGELDWMRFSITLWLPAGWKTPHGLTATAAPCAQ
ncbi:MAG: hypothetical protein WAL45_21510 [Terracidiphilus sp.]